MQLGGELEDGHQKYARNYPLVNQGVPWFCWDILIITMADWAPRNRPNETLEMPFSQPINTPSDANKITPKSHYKLPNFRFSSLANKLPDSRAFWPIFLQQLGHPLKASFCPYKHPSTSQEHPKFEPRTAEFEPRRPNLGVPSGLPPSQDYVHKVS